MKTIEIISQDLFDKVRSRFTNLEMGDELGAVTMDPRQARFYDFDFAVEGHNYGRVSVSINELGTLKIFYGQSILEDIDQENREHWYDFLKEMRLFAMRRLLRFDTRDITKNNLEKDDFQYLATNGSKEDNMNVSESVKFEGSSKTSYGKLSKARVVVRHKKQVEETPGSRKRAGNISAIFVENEEGERFKYPFIHTAGALAMAQHVSHGGKPYDDHGNAIVGMSKQISELIGCTKHMGLHDSMNTEAHQIAEKVQGRLTQLRDCMKSIAGPKGYRAWAEAFSPIAESEEGLDEATIEDYKTKFTSKSFKEDLAQYFPLIHSIMKEVGEVDLEEYVGEGSNKQDLPWDDEKTDKSTFKKPTNPNRTDYDTAKALAQKGLEKSKSAEESFESWAESVAEGQLDDNQIAEIKKLLDANMTLGSDGTAAIGALQNIGLDDPELIDLIEKASKNPNAELGNVLAIYLPKADSNAAQQLGLTPEVPQLPAPDAGQEDPAMDPNAAGMEQPEEQPTAEGGIGNDVAPKGWIKDAGKKPTVGSKMRDLANGIKAFAKDDKEAEKKLDTYESAEDEDAIIDKDTNGKNPSMKDLADWVGAFYNPNFKESGFKSPWRKGVTELSTMAEKQFGHPYGHLVEKMVSEYSETPLQRISREGGIRNAEKEEDMGPSHAENPALPMGPKEADDRNGTGTFAENTEDMNFKDIMRLAGLAK